LTVKAPGSIVASEILRQLMLTRETYYAASVPASI
jgi:hypothetical protein